MFSILLAISLGFQIDVSHAQAVDAKIAVVFSTGGLGDQSFNDAANVGLQEAKAQYTLETDQTEPADVDEINAAIESYAEDGSYDLIIAIGFSSFDGVDASAAAHPTQQFMIVDSVVDRPNVASVVFSEHEGSFIVGAIAAMTSQTDSIAFLGGLDIPLINKFRSGYEQGARYINPDIEIASAYSPDPSNPWGDLAGGKTLAETFIENGADIIFAAAGGTGLGVFDAALEAQQEGNVVFGIGVDSNQDHLQKGVVLTSMVKRVDVAVKTQIDAIVADTWAPTIVELGLAEEGVGATDMEFTQSIANADCTASESILEYANSIGDLIIAGTVVVDEEVKTSGFNTVSHACSSPLDLSDYLNSDESDSPIPMAPLFIGMFITVFFVRKVRKN